MLKRIEDGEEIKERELLTGIRVGISDVERLINRFVVAPGASEMFIAKIKGVCAAANMSCLGNKLKRSCFHYDWLNRQQEQMLPMQLNDRAPIGS